MMMMMMLRLVPVSVLPSVVAWLAIEVTGLVGELLTQGQLLPFLTNNPTKTRLLPPPGE